jgi:hypothetical protein
MTNETRVQIRRAIAEDEEWIVRASALITPDADCSSIEDSIARAQHQVDRMRALL